MALIESRDEAHPEIGQVKFLDIRFFIGLYSTTSLKKILEKSAITSCIDLCRKLAFINHRLHSYRWEDRPVSRSAPARNHCRPEGPLKVGGAAVSCAPEEVCVSASELSPGQRRGQPIRAEDPVKVRSQQRASPSQPHLSGRQPVRKPMRTQVKGPGRHVVAAEHGFISTAASSSCSVWRNLCFLHA